MKRHIFFILTLLLTLVSVGDLAAQNMPERALVRKGNRLFAKERYDHSSEAYQSALLHDSTSFEARYNLASALFRKALADTTAFNDPQGSAANLSSGYIQQAEGLLQAAAADSLRSEADRAEAYYNLGNAQFVQQKLQEALRSYRRSLKLNPADMEAKYNYALTKKLLEQQQNQDQNQNNDNQDQNQDQNQNQNQNQNQDQNGDGNNDQNQNQNQNQDQNQDQNQNDQNQNQNDDQNKNNDQNQNGGGNNDQQNDKQQGQAPPRSGMNDKQREQVLNAIQAQEDKTQEKLDEEAKGVIVRGRKNW